MDGAIVKSINILLIEDSPTYVLLVRSMLADVKSGSFELVCGESLATGLKRLAQDDVDVILLDLTLPDCQGLDTFTKVRTEAKGIPIVVLTSLDDETLALTALQDGAADYLVKSEVNGNWLARSLLYAVERKRAVKRPDPQEAVEQCCLEVKETDGISIVRFFDKKIVGLITLDEMKRRLFHLVDQARCRKLLLNFSNVEYISNAAIGILVGLYKKANAIEGRLILCNVSPEVYEHFATRKLHKMFDIRSEEKAALKAFE